MIKKGPYILILILIIFLIFILGVRYGQKVERTNKIINYLISIPPSPTGEPTQIPLSFKTYVNKICGVKFLYPSNFKIGEESSESAKFQNELFFDCAKHKYPELSFPDQVRMSDKTIIFKNRAVPMVKSENETSFWITNPQNNKAIFITVSDTYYPLFEKSLEFTL